MLGLKSQLDATETFLSEGWVLCSVLKYMNDWSHLIHFSSLSFIFQYSRAWLSVVVSVSVCVGVVASSSLGAVIWLTLLLWCCVCVPARSTLFIFLSGVKDSAATDICFLKWIIHLIISLVLFLLLLTSGTRTWRDAGRSRETGGREGHALVFQI